MGLYVGDPLRFKRIENLIKHQERVEALLASRKVQKTEEVSPKIAAPILEHAANKSHHELQELWARLMAAAADPARANGVRLSFIETVKEFDPLDALVLVKIRSDTTFQEGFPFAVAGQLKSTPDEVLVSLQNLGALELCAAGLPDFRTVGLTPKGRELMRVLYG